MCICLSFILIIELSPTTTKWKFKRISGILILMIITVFGGISYKAKSHTAIAETAIPKGIYLLRIEEDPKKTQTGFRYIATCFEVKNRTYKKITGTYVYVTATSKPSLQEGDWVLSSSPLIIIPKKNNPGAYDFATQSALKGIFLKTTVKDTGALALMYHDKNIFRESIAKTRKWIIALLETSLPDKRIAGLAEAMIIGYREDLDKDLLASYVNTGVVHIIAISGLHLSLIFIIIDFFVRISFGKKRTDVVGLFITIPILWAFAILTGSSASVIRSALMLTVVLMSKGLNKKTNGLNALLASALILLMHNPETLYDIGFQLSYTAVASILIFDPIIKKSIYVQNILLKKCWEMISITLSAQLLTTPLTIFYFHQFPTLFLFTNLVAVPLSSIILISEILLCFAAIINLPIFIPAEITTQLIKWLNLYIQKMEHIPFGMIKHLYIGSPTLFLMYVFLVIFFRLIQQVNLTNTKYLTLAFLMMSLVQLADILHHKKYKRIVILHVYGKTCIFFQKGGTGVIATSMNLLENKKTLQEIRNQLGAAYWIKDFQFVKTPIAPSMLTIDVEKITGNNQKNISKMMILTGSPRIQLEDLPIQNEKKLLIVADGSNKLWKIQQWETEADRLLLHFNSVAKEGPLILESQQ
jgi:competence protein ComEC